MTRPLVLVRPKMEIGAAIWASCEPHELTLPERACADFVTLRNRWELLPYPLRCHPLFVPFQGPQPFQPNQFRMPVGHADVDTARQVGFEIDRSLGNPG